MSVTVAAVQIAYTGNGITTEFAVPFKFLESDDLTVESSADGVTYTTLTEDVDYTVEGDGDDEGEGVVTTLVAVANLSTLRITRATDLTQESDFQPQGAFPVARHETALDKLTLIVQELDARLQVVEALADLVDVTEAAAGVVYTGALTTSNPVENSFPLALVVAGGLNAKYIVWHIYATAANDNPMSTPPAVDWVPGPGANQVTVRAISGLLPAVDYTIKALVLF
jgi:hypothetical protein